MQRRWIGIMTTAILAVARIQRRNRPVHDISITGRDGITYHVHLTAKEARQFVDFVDELT